MSELPPLDRIRTLSRRGATGELICAVADLEVHVFLQDGRVAWATSSGARFAFSRDLVRRCGIEPTALREIVEDCRRSRRPLGETLIAWNLATHDDVRASLRMQIVGALETLVDRAGAPSLFLERDARTFAYDRALTFALDELLGGSEGAEPPRSSSSGHTELLDRLLDDVPELRWAEVLHGDSVIAARPAGSAPRVSTQRVADLAFGAGVDVVVLRVGLGTMVGVAREDDTSLWLGLGREARLGSVFAALADLVPTPRSSIETRPTGSLRASGAPCRACVPVLEDVLARWSDADAACVVGGEDGATTVHREGVDAAAIADLAISRTPILAIDEIADDTHEAGETDLSAFARSARSLVLGRSASWHLGTPVPDESGRVVWLTVSRRGSQGLAWALLAATARQLAQVPCGARKS